MITQKIDNRAPFSVAAVNVAAPAFDLEGGLAAAEDIVREAVDAGASLVAFPELWLPGFINGVTDHPPADFQTYVDASVEVGSEAWAKLLSIAAAHAVHLSIGFSEKRGHRLLMSQALIAPDGTAISVRSKLKPSGEERNYFSDAPSSGFLDAIDTSLGRISQLLCSENYQPRMTIPVLAQHADLHIAAYPKNGMNMPTFLFSYDWQETVIKHLAVSGGRWVILPSVGRAAIVDTNGRLVASADGGPTRFVIAEIDPGTFSPAPNSFTRKYFTPDAVQEIQNDLADAPSSDGYYAHDAVVDVRQLVTLP